MASTHQRVALERTDAPPDRPVDVLDVRTLGPPEPLVRTLERLADLPDETILVQRNDRQPGFLYPKLEARGYAFETVELETETVTVIWRREPTRTAEER
ncbi:DUF2249 domain-containing protein [Natronobiforma cellulositropha]|uniref:DUF2249 domain-containing protein n=1 Tax=Natronobiforma cellulositropha TaxID=1679076 RepID=UPI0021D5E0D5|nr:DUF2249 domain-containing protein [Natronobiforma cellulositropha]